jgi:hypothetical protein
MSNTNQQYDQVISSCKEIYLKKAKGLWNFLACFTHHFNR